MPSAVLSKLHPAIYTSFRRAVIENFGLSHFLPYSTHLLSPTTQFTQSKSHNRRQTMAVSGSKTVFGDVYIDEKVTSTWNDLSSKKHTGVYFADQSSISCRRASVSLKRQEQSNRHMPIHTSSLAYFSTRAAHDVFDANSSEEQTTKSSDQATLGKTTLKLLSGSCYLPHPAKVETGGEDAHFISVNEQAIGVADGVGGWAEVGVDAGEFARELMSNSIAAIQDESKGSINPARVLEKAHSSTKAKGSSTACIIALTNEGINAINLGDSGFMVIRDGCTVFHSPVQQHGFNFTYQLESGNTGDLPSSGQVFTIPASLGDVIVAGTDGLFDNLYHNEVTAVVVHAVRAGLGPQDTAQEIAALARQRAEDRKRQTPFAIAAQDAGFRYYGGKLDDITVVVSYISSNTNM